MKAKGKPALPVGRLTICSRGHKFYKNALHPVCPICWPGRYKKLTIKK